LEWGVGLEDLTDVYFRVCRNYLVTRSRVYPVRKIFMRTALYSRGFPFLHEIDVVAFRNSEIILVQCTQKKIKLKMAEKMEKELASSVWDFKVDYEIPEDFKIRKCIVYTEMSRNARELLHKKQVELISAKEMLTELIRKLPQNKRPEPIIWLLKTLSENGLLKQDLNKTI